MVLLKFIKHYYKQVAFFTFMCFVLPLTIAASEPKNDLWYTDYSEALKEAVARELPLMLFFNGSDWCGLSMKLKNEMMNSDDFMASVYDRFICLNIDFPKYSALLESLEIQNNNLRNEWNIKELPMMLLLDYNENKLGEIASYQESIDSLGSELICVVELANKLNGIVDRLWDLDINNLKKYYYSAMEIGRYDVLSKILEEGRRRNDLFLLTELFRSLIESGYMGSEESNQIKQQLYSLKNEMFLEARFNIALIEFQELSKMAESNNIHPSVVVEPLESYISEFGEIDFDNRWRLEVMISQFYYSMDMVEKAAQHAKIALSSSPDDLSVLIADSMKGLLSH